MKNLTKFISVLLALILIVGCIPVGAVGVIKETTDIGFETFTYWNNAITGNGNAVRATGMYDFYKTFYNEDFEGANIASYSDITVDNNDNFYILDGDTSQVHIFDKNYKYLRSFGAMTNAEGETLDFTGARGIVISNDNIIYICDTTHERVLLVDVNGNFVSELLLPDSGLIPEDFKYRPNKVAVDSSNYIYVLSEGSFYGAILYSPKGEFLGFFGANTVSATVLDFLASIWDKLTMTDAKRSAQIKKIPFQFTDLYVDKQDFVYTATGRTEKNSIDRGQIKRLSPGGLNILNSAGTTFGLQSAIPMKNNYRYPDIAGVAVSSDNYIYSYDVNSGYISIFNDDCKMLNSFGGGATALPSNLAGFQDGTFQDISAIDITSDKDLIILDDTKKCITVYKINDYGRLVIKADTLTKNGDYDDALPLWQEVLTMDRNSQVAYSGIAKSYYASGDYKQAMKYAKIGYDYSTYSLSYDFVRRDIIEKYVYLFAAIILVIVVAVAVFLRYKRKNNIVIIKNNELKLLSRVMLHPSEVFTEVKEKKSGSVLLGLILIILFYITSTIKETASGFLFKSPTNTGFNSFLVLMQSLGLVLLWTICNWAVCTLMSGKGKMREIFLVASYSVVPLIISNIVYTIASNVILESEAAFLSIFVTVMQLFMAYILIAGTLVIHDYGFAKFVGTTLLSAFGILIVIFLGIIIVILVQQLGNFVGTVYREIVFR